MDSFCYIYIGGTAPYSEKCVLVGQPGYDFRAKLEGQLFIDQIYAYYGKPKGSGELRVGKSLDYDPGTYYSLEYGYCQNDKVALDYGNMIEKDDQKALARWDSLRAPLAKMIRDMKELSDIEDYRRLVLETYRNEINKAINTVNERYEKEYGRL